MMPASPIPHVSSNKTASGSRLRILDKHIECDVVLLAHLLKGWPGHTILHHLVPLAA